jgi:hypothetical protein
MKNERNVLQGDLHEQCAHPYCDLGTSGLVIPQSNLKLYIVVRTELKDAQTLCMLSLTTAACVPQIKVSCNGHGTRPCACIYRPRLVRFC